jgi:hypothetical protein
VCSWASDDASIFDSDGPEKEISIFDSGDGLIKTNFKFLVQVSSKVEDSKRKFYQNLVKFKP